jgi:hypothetical protein
MPVFVTKIAEGVARPRPRGALTRADLADNLPIEAADTEEALMSSERCYSWLRTLLCCALAACGGGSSNHRGDDGPTDGPTTMYDAGGPSDGPDDGPIDTGTGTGSSARCDFIHQTGCSANEKCDLAADGLFGCVPDGTLTDFQVCDDTRPNACAAGFTCSGTFFDAHRCTRLCSQLENQCRSNEPCQEEHTTSDNKQFLTCVTREECNPVTDDCIPAGTHCTYLLVISACRMPGTVADGAICQIQSGDSQDCAQGSACITVGPGNTKKCVKLCNPAGGNPACAAGSTCTTFTKVGPQDVGMCSLP